MRAGTCRSLAVGLLAVVVAGRAAAATGAYEVLPGSRLWLEGRTNVDAFTCEAPAHRIDVDVRRLPADRMRPITWEDVHLRATVAVDGLDCGQQRMERDLRAVLDSRRFPDITFAFVAARDVSDDGGSADRRLRMWGDLTVVGVRRGIDFVVDGRPGEEGTVRARGRVAIRMTDHGVEPPRRLLGLIRVRDELVVRFDLVLQPESRAVAADAPAPAGAPQPDR